MKQRWMWLPLAVMLACGGKEPDSAKTLSAREPLLTARVEQAPQMLEIAGTVRAADVAELGTRVGGFVTEVRVHAGSQVKAGDLLVVLDDRSLQAQSEKVHAAEGEVRQAIEEARQHLQAAGAQNELATTTFERIRSLYEKKSASRQELDEAQSRKVAAEAGWQAARERLAQAESRLRQVASETQVVSANLSYQRMTAPFDGVVTSMTADAGTFIQPGQVVVVMEDPREYQIVFSVEQELLSSVLPGAKFSVRVPAADPELLEAIIDEVSPSADQATRTFLVKATVSSSAGLRTGLSGRVVVPVASRSSLWIPADFLARHNDIETVMVKADSDWRRVLVKSGNRDGDRIEILSGLNEGEEIGLFEERK